MVSVTAADFHTLMHLTVSDISLIETEKILDAGIGGLNNYGKLEISNLHGTAGSKTLSVDSKTEYAIYLIAHAIYKSFYKGITSASVGGISVTTEDLMSNSAVLESLKEAAQNLREMDWSRAII